MHAYGEGRGGEQSERLTIEEGHEEIEGCE